MSASSHDVTRCERAALAKKQRGGEGGGDEERDSRKAIQKAASSEMKVI
jgi:hypothetical protein